MRLEDLEQGLAVRGVLPGSAVTVLAITWHGPDAVNLTYRSDREGLGEAVLYRSDEVNLELAVSSRRPFDADADDVKLGLEAQRIRRAGLYDPMLAVATSSVTPLPHQIRAVYGEMLHHHPLRFLLADDPGAGKTIMAGLLIKELILREDVRRALIVAPGGLVDQWRDELEFKFGMQFDVLSAADAYATAGRSPLQTKPFLIARMDQLARNEGLLEQLETSEWDLVVVDEAHRMSASWFGQSSRPRSASGSGQVLGEVARHFLLMTATPHNGNEDAFQTFLSLLDEDEFAGKAPTVGRRQVDTSRVMRRMVKEELLTFEGTPLFPERVAQTVSYDLSPDEQHLYDVVTEYVREGMGRADALGGKRRRTVGFALTVLQRRLASSPAAIHESLLRRAARLQRRADDLAKGIGVLRPDDTPRRSPSPDDPYRDLDDLGDEEEWSAEEAEQLEDELVDAATAARTEAELRTEIAELNQLAAKGPARAAQRARRQVGRAAHDPRGQRPRATRGREPQADRLHRAPRHPRLPRRPHRPGSRRPRRRRRHARRGQPGRPAPHRGGVHPQPRLPRPGRDRRRR